LRTEWSSRISGYQAGGHGSTGGGPGTQTDPFSCGAKKKKKVRSPKVRGPSCEEKRAKEMRRPVKNRKHQSESRYGNVNC